MGSVGGSKSKGKTNPATIWAPQGAELQKLYGRAEGMFGTPAVAASRTWVPGQSQAPSPYNTGQLDEFGNAYGGGGAFNYGNARPGQQQAASGYWQETPGQAATAGKVDQYDQLAQGYLDQGHSQLDAGASGMRDQASWLQQFRTPGIDPMADVYARNVAQNFNEQIMPGIRGNAAMSGGMGGSRQGIAEGLAAGRSSQQLQDFNAQLYGQQADRSLQAAGAYGQNAAAQAGLSTDYANLGQFQQALPWYALQQYAGILGRPTPLTGGGSQSSSGFNIGIS